MGSSRAYVPVAQVETCWTRALYLYFFPSSLTFMPPAGVSRDHLSNKLLVRKSSSQDLLGEVLTKADSLREPQGHSPSPPLQQGEEYQGENRRQQGASF